MTYRSILVPLARDKHQEARTRIAIRMAADMDAHLVGLAPTGLVELPMTLEAAAIGPLSELTWNTLRDEARQAEQQFRGQCEAARLKSFESLVDEADTVESIVRHAHCSDLCVMGQPDPSHPGSRAARLQLEQVVLQSARPTLVLPYAGHFEHVGRDALVAWDDSREAARALADALPLLRRSRQVVLVSWGERSEPGLAGGRLEAVKRWLLWQGVTAQTRNERSDIAIADAMLSLAADLGSDLIVMGAYGHARWSEIMLGGATRGLLESMTAPVLMSH